MSETEKDAGLRFKLNVENFLGNKKSENWEEMLHNVITNFGKEGCLISLKLHFLDSHLKYFPENLRDYSEK